MKGTHKCLGTFFALLLLVFGIVFVLCRMAEPILPETHPPEVLYPYIDQKFEAEWMETISKGKINHVEVWNPYGLSKKFKVIFEDGKVTSGKLMRPFSLWPQYFHQHTYRDADRIHKRYSRPAHGDYQALGELGSFYVDRALGWWRKPPTTGRKISNKLMYAMDPTWFGFFQRLLPEYEIEVSLIAWFDGIRVKPPEDRYLEIMLHNEEASGGDLRIVEQIARVMIFDFLVDDHDRIEAHNWLKDTKGEYIFWDNGLAWRHGTSGKRERDRDIFCGRREWVARTQERNGGKCERVCMFGNKTVTELRAYGLERESVPGPKLSKKVYSVMADDPLFPVFHYNIYLPSSGRFPKVTYRYQDFLEGIDIRLREVLAYIDECIETYGEEKVLINAVSPFDR